ncbi:MAG: hypothetical protein CMJ98_11230 [Planctomycetes bacterium]|jgi:nitrate reductase delta subunit|nr:hypothetical protein [Planctomycetota bacterium]HJM57915.1 molecular chaperone TorD family protein [Planctomycetota bacterium]
MTIAVLEAFSNLLCYPGDGRAVKVNDWIDQIRIAAPTVNQHLEGLRSYASDHEESDLEELFVRTFENNKERALELGWHLHGENYARGTFMARLRGLLRDLEIEETVELPDHVSHLLSIISRAEPGLAGALARSAVTPGLDKILEGFGEKENPYYGVILGLQAYVGEYFAKEETGSEAASR